MPKRGGDSSNKNIARDAPPGRFPKGLAQEALENDLGNLASTIADANATSSRRLRVRDDTTTLDGINIITLDGSLQVAPGGVGEAIVSDGNEAGDTDFRPLIDVDFVAQSENYSENVDRNNKPIPLQGIDQFRYILHQTNSGGGTYTLQYWNGSTWVAVSSSFTTAGNQDLSYYSGWINIPQAVIDLNEAVFRVSHTGTGGSTDTSLCTIQFRGPVVKGPKGDQGDAAGGRIWQPLIVIDPAVTGERYPVEKFVYALYNDDSGDQHYSLVWAIKDLGE